MLALAIYAKATRTLATGVTLSIVGGESACNLGCSESIISIDLSCPLSSNGFGAYHFGATATEAMGKPFSPSLVPGPNGEECMMKGIRDPRFGFDSLHLGFTMQSQRLCNLGLCRNFDYAVADTEIYAMLTNVHLWIANTFGASVKTNPSFDLHSPPNALYAKVENDSLEMRLEASRRKDAMMAWLMMSMSDKHLLKEADIEYDCISKDESIKEEVTERRNRANWLAPLSYAMPLYAVFCLPVFLLLLIVYVITMKVRRAKSLKILHWADPFALLLAPYAWGCFEHVGQTKSLSNVVEFAIIGWGWCLCMAIRYAMSIMGRRTCERYYGYVTFAIVVLFAILMAILFPTLPE
jgi:hypothetical protein